MQKVNKCALCGEITEGELCKGLCHYIGGKYSIYNKGLMVLTDRAKEQVRRIYQKHIENNERAN